MPSPVSATAFDKLRVAPGDLVEITFESRDREVDKYFGYYGYFHPLRRLHWISAKKKGSAGWLVEPWQIVRIVERAGRRHGRRHR